MAQLTISVPSSEILATVGQQVVSSAGTGKELSVTILLVDSDLGFIFWLGQALDAEGFRAVPALNIPAARELLERHKLSVDILVIDPSLPDAFLFISELRQSRPPLHIVATTSENWGPFPKFPKFDAIVPKPQRLSVTAVSQWLHVIQSLSLNRNPADNPPGPADPVAKKTMPDSD